MPQATDSWTDVTYPIYEGMVHWPGQPPVQVHRIKDLHCGDSANVSVLHLSAHTGTHMDAPMHFLKEHGDITTAPQSVMMGSVRVAALGKVGQIQPEHIRSYEERTGDLQPGERLILRTGNSDREDWTKEEFDQNYAAITPEAARLLAERQILMVGVDYLSVGPFEVTAQTHHALLEAGIWIVEGIDLRKIKEGQYEMICLPLPIRNCDASPVRMLLRKSG